MSYRLNFVQFFVQQFNCRRRSLMVYAQVAISNDACKNVVKTVQRQMIYEVHLPRPD